VSGFSLARPGPRNAQEYPWYRGTAFRKMLLEPKLTGALYFQIQNGKYIYVDNDVYFNSAMS
jgi:hypothetical protein